MLLNLTEILPSVEASRYEYHADITSATEVVADQLIAVRDTMCLMYGGQYLDPLSVDEAKRLAEKRLHMCGFGPVIQDQPIIVWEGYNCLPLHSTLLQD